MAVGSKGSSGGGGRNQNKTKPADSQPNREQLKGTSKSIEPIVPAKVEAIQKPEPPKIQPTAEQIRLAQITASSRRDDPDVEDKVKQLVDLSNKSADACLSALHDADYDIEKAIELLLEGVEDQWEVSGRKKKQKPPKAPVVEIVEDDLPGDKKNDANAWDNDNRGSRSRGGGPPRFRGRGRGRDGFSDGPERGRGGRGRGRGGARGGRGGYRGNIPTEVTVFDSPMETWGGTPQEKPEEELKVDNWGDDFPAAEDWDNEEYTVSLADTKVFTASSAVVPESPAPAGDQGLSNGDKFHEPDAIKVPPAPVGSVTHPSIDLNHLLQKSTNAVQQQSQSSYMSSYTQQASETLKAAIGVGLPSQHASSSLFTSPQVVQGQFSPNTQLQQQRAKLVKPKLPPPSKIPSSAVEMPDDTVSQLDIQFGGLEFGTDSTSVEFGSNEQNSGYTAETHSLLSSKTEPYGSAASNTPVVQPSQTQPKATGFPIATTGYTQQQTSYSSVQSSQAVSTTSPTIVSQASTTYQTSTNYQTGFQSGGASNYGSTVYSPNAYPSGYGASSTVNKLPGVTSTQSYDSTTVTSSSTSSMSAGTFGLTPSVSAAPAVQSVTPASAVSQRVVPNAGSGMPSIASSVGKGVGMPPGVPAQMLGQYVMSQAPPGLPFAYAGLAQQPIYSMEDVQNLQYLQRYQQPLSNTTAMGGRDTGLAGYDPSKFQRNENNSPVPTATTLTGQAGGTPYLNPAGPAQLAAGPAYAYFYSNLPSGFQYGAPAAAAIYPVSAATTGATASSYKSPSASQAPYGYGGYDSSDYTKTAYVNQSMAKTAADLGVGASVHGKTATYQLGKSGYDKGFHTGTPPPFGMTGASAAHLGNPVAAGYPQMFVPAMPHQSASALIHQQLHGDNLNSQRGSAGGQGKGAPSSKPYGGSYWGN